MLVIIEMLTLYIVLILVQVQWLFELSPKNTIINDSDNELMNVYECIKDEKRTYRINRMVSRKSNLKVQNYYENDL